MSWVRSQTHETGVKVWRLDSAVIYCCSKTNWKIFIRGKFFFLPHLKQFSLSITEINFSVVHFHFQGTSSQNAVQLLCTEQTKYFNTAQPLLPSFLIQTFWKWCHSYHSSYYFCSTSPVASDLPAAHPTRSLKIPQQLTPATGIRISPQKPSTTLESGCHYYRWSPMEQGICVSWKDA